MEKIRFGLVGLGSMGLAHCKTLLTEIPEAELTAVTTANPTHAAQLKALPGGERVRIFNQYQEMLDSGLIDAVLIVTPHRLHAEQAVAAFKAGLHVLLEKPAGVSTLEARRISAAADESGKAYGLMFNQRVNPAYRKMKEIIASGEMGEIRRTTLIITDWFRAQSYFDSAAWRATWKRDGGGVLLNQAPHNLDLWQWICGMPVRVRAFCRMGHWHDIEVEDDVTAYVEYANGASGTFITCTGEAPGTNRFEVSMDGGQLLFEKGRLTLSKLSVPAGKFIREYQGGYGQPACEKTDITPDAPDLKHACVIRAFARHILYGEPLVADGREALNSLELSCGMLLSSWTDKTLDLPIDDELFARLLEERAAKSPDKAAKEIVMDVGKSGF